MRASDRSRLVSHDWGRMYVVDRGPADDACPIVLIHGYLVTHHEYRDVFPALARSRRVLALDLPGCGESDRPAPELVEGYSFAWLARAVVATLDALAIDQVDLVGHSMGGAVAVHLADTHAGRVRKLALIDALSFAVTMPLEGRLALLPGVGSFVFRRLYRRADLRRYLARAYSTPEVMDEAAVDLYWDRLARAGGREAAAAMLQNFSNLEPLCERFPRIEQETLVLWGDGDSIMPSEHGERLAAALPHATLQIVEGCGHAPNEERPQVVVDALEHFFA